MIEMMLTISAITIILGIGIPVYQSLQNRNGLDIAATTITQSLRRAQVLSQSGEGDANWGVKIVSGNIIIFKGADFSSRDQGSDEIFDTLTSIVPSGLTEVVFEKSSGLPGAFGEIGLTFNSRENRNITINEKGTINY